MNLSAYETLLGGHAVWLPLIVSLAVSAGAATQFDPAPADARPKQHPGKPAVRLYAIASGDNGKCLEADLRALAEKFEMVYGGFTKEQMDFMRKQNPAFKILKYVGTYSTNTSSKLLPAPEAEKRRSELLCYLAGRLAEAATARAGKLKLKPIAKDAPLVFKPSTAEGEFSQTKTSDSKALRYVTWIRIGAEYMRVNGFDPASGELTVQRGFAGSTPTAHASGAPVLHPVYLQGSCPGIEKDDYGRPARNIAYIPDPASPLRWDVTLQEDLAALEKGYDGIWIDCLGSRPFNPVDVGAGSLNKAVSLPRSDEDLLGDRQSKSQPVLRLWNLAENKPYTEEAFRVFCEKGITQMQDRLHERLGKWPLLYANNIGPGYFPEKGGRKAFLMPTTAKPRPLDGFCLECYAGTMGNEGFAKWYYDKGQPTPPKPHDPEHWKYAESVCMDAAQDRLAICPMMHQAGWKTMMHEALPLAERGRFEAFAYASYLLTIEKGAPTMFGLPAFYISDKGRYAWLPDLYFRPIGDPAESHKPGDIDRYCLAGHTTYARRFTNGLVLVNPAAEADAGIRLGRSYHDPETGQPATTVTMPASSGKILLIKPNN